MKRHKHIYSERKEGNTIIKSFEISDCPFEDKQKCLKFEFKRNKSGKW